MTRPSTLLHRLLSGALVACVILVPGCSTDQDTTALMAEKFIEGDHAEVLGLAREALEKNPENVDALRYSALAQLAQTVEWKKTDPLFPEARINKARESAQTALKKAADLKKDDVVLRYLEMRLAQDLGKTFSTTMYISDYEDPCALMSLKAHAKENPYNKYDERCLGETLAGLGQLEVGAKDYENTYFLLTTDNRLESIVAVKEDEDFVYEINMEKPVKTVESKGWVLGKQIITPREPGREHLEEIRKVRPNTVCNWTETTLNSAPADHKILRTVPEGKFYDQLTFDVVPYNVLQLGRNMKATGTVQHLEQKATDAYAAQIIHSWYVEVTFLENLGYQLKKYDKLKLFPGSGSVKLDKRRARQYLSFNQIYMPKSAQKLLMGDFSMGLCESMFQNFFGEYAKLFHERYDVHGYHSGYAIDGSPLRLFFLNGQLRRVSRDDNKVTPLPNELMGLPPWEG